MDFDENSLLHACGSQRWAREMAQSGPYQDAETLIAKANDVWWSLAPEDWLEAFRSHPKIGEKKAAAPVSDRSRQWSGQEQAGVSNAPRETVDALAALNHAYEQKFGFIFIICATGKSSEEMLSALRQRLDNDPATELPPSLGRTEQDYGVKVKKINKLRVVRGTLAPTMSTISTHILDTSRGAPASGVAVCLEIQNTDESWTELSHAWTDTDGRVKPFFLVDRPVSNGAYRLVFDTEPYFSSLSVSCFYPQVTVVFNVDDGSQHYHVPLLISPYGYSTYRGS